MDHDHEDWQKREIAGAWYCTACGKDCEPPVRRDA